MHLRANTLTRTLNRAKIMGKKKSRPEESLLKISAHPASKIPIVDTHTHLLSTFVLYREKYPDGKFQTVGDFVRGLYGEVESIVDVWCEAPVRKEWRELADSVDWGDMSYRFVIGA